METSVLTGPALDWAVAKAAGYLSKLGDHWMVTLPDVSARMNFVPNSSRSVFSPSTRWSQGGPIIERECIEVSCLHLTGFTPDIWTARHPLRAWATGPTPLIAAMRCFVARQLGDIVDIPEELCANQA